MIFQIDNITFSYNERQIIDRLSANLKPGKFYGILGPNGCGKTTFLDLLVKHRQPISGNIYYHGNDLSRYSTKELSKEIALVAQNFYINFPFTVKEIVMMGRYPHIPRFASPSPEDVEQVEEIMEKTGVNSFRNRFITELSGGERQRVVFARALAQDTPVLILDEATSNLDINHTIGMLNLAAQGVKKQNKTVIAVVQDINLAASYCEYLLFMKKGRIVAKGPTDSVLTPDTIRSVFNVGSKVYFDTFSNSKQVVFGR